MKGRVQENWLAWLLVLYQRDGLSWLTSALINLKKDNGSLKGCFVSRKGTY